MKLSHSKLFWLLTIGVCILLVVPALIQDGMFADGLLYTSVAKNQGNGLGTFWNPYFSESWEHAGRGSFHEQPPLVFYMLGQFFKLFGNGILTERIYVMLTTGLSIFLIHRIWTILPHKLEEVRRMSWLPVLIWITFPVVMWTHQQMLCENTVEVFVLASVYFMLKSLFSNKRIILSMILAGGFVFLASFSKGVPGLFPIVTMPFFFLVYKKHSFIKSASWAALVVLMPVLIYALLMLNPEANEALKFYFNERLVGRIQTSPVVSDRFQVMKELLVHLLVPFGAIGLYFGVLKWKKKTIQKWDRRLVILLTLIGLSGAVPLMITLIQRGFYMTPAMPFLALAIALIPAPSMAQHFQLLPEKPKNMNWLKSIAAVFLIGGITLSILSIGKTERDHDRLELSYAINNYIEPGGIVRISGGLYNDLSLMCYLMRNAEISYPKLGEEDACNYYLTKTPNDVPFNGEAVQIGPYYLFEKLP